MIIKIVFAILAQLDATPPKPKTLAIKAITKKIKAPAIKVTNKKIENQCCNSILIPFNEVKSAAPKIFSRDGLEKRVLPRLIKKRV